MKPKLNQTEKNALAMCQRIQEYGRGTLNIEWSRAGHASLFSPMGVKCAHAGGGGYCKESTVLADALRFLYPIESPEYYTIWKTGGAGVRSVENALAGLGWKLDPSGKGKAFDCYTITREGGAL